MVDDLKAFYSRIVLGAEIMENRQFYEKLNICRLVDSHFFSLYFWTSDFMIYFSTDALSDV